MIAPEGECDCCGRKYADLTFMVVFGVETYVCPLCLEDNDDEEEEQ